MGGVVVVVVEMLSCRLCGSTEGLSEVGGVVERLPRLDDPLEGGLCKFDSVIGIDDVTNVYQQKNEGIGISICLNEPLHYSMALSLQGLCNVAGVLKDMP